MATMEHPEATVSAPALVNRRVLLYFCNAAQACGDGLGAHDDVAGRIRDLRLRLDNLRGLASLCRLAIIGDPRSAECVVDEMSCLAVDFPGGPLEELSRNDEPNEDEPDYRVVLGAAVDLFAGASFVSKDQPEQRDRFVVAIVRAIESAIAFPAAFAAEAATYLGAGEGDVLPLHARLVMSNATQRLLEDDRACDPRVPLEIRRRLYCLARRWLREDPVEAFFAAISGPKVRSIVHWEDPERVRPDDARVGDAVTILVERSPSADDCCGDDLRGCVVMFCPHTPAPVVRVVLDGLQVRVPAGSRTGPIAVLKRSPDFAPVQALLARYASCFPVEWSTSIFARVRMDVWAFPTAFAPPILEIFSQRGPNPPTRLPLPMTPPGEMTHSNAPTAQVPQ